MSDDKRERPARHTPVDAWETAVAGIDSDAWLRRFRLQSRPHETPDDALAFYTRIFLEAPVSILILTMDYTVADANLASQALLGRQISAFRGKPFQWNVAKTDRRAFLDIRTAIKSQTSPISRPLLLVDSTGNETETRVIASALRDDKGEPEFILMMLFDRGKKITEDLL